MGLSRQFVVRPTWGEVLGRLRRGAALTAVLGFVAAACNPLLGIDDYKFGDPTSGSGAASGSSGGDEGGTGVSGGTGGTGVSGGTAGAGGTGASGGTAGIGGIGGTGASGGTGGTGGGGGCTTGELQPCYDGLVSTKGVGVCKPGTQTCFEGTWGPCDGQVLPSAQEICDGNDNDCDGQPLDADAGCLCVPGSTVDCYTGPDGTKNVAACKGGTQTCQPDGKGYGTCDDEVVPSVELCNTPAVDENCDAEPACTGVYRWSKSIAKSGKPSIAVDRDGNIIVATSTSYVEKRSTSGDFLWGVNNGVTSNTGRSGLATDSLNNIVIAGASIVKLDSGGTELWKKQFAGGNDGATALAVDQDGNILIAGYFLGDLGLGNNCQPVGDRFLAKLDPANGNCQWGIGFDISAVNTKDAIVDISTDAEGNIYIGGSFLGTANINGYILQANGAAVDLFLAKFDPSGSTEWIKHFGSEGSEFLYDLAVDKQGNIALAGQYTGIFNFGGPDLLEGYFSVFLAKLDQGGGYVWSKEFNAKPLMAGTATSIDAAGNVILMGYCLEMGDVGSGTLFDCNNPNGDNFLAKYGSITGDHLWSKHFVDANPPVSASNTDVAVDASGNVVVAGTFIGPLTLGDVVPPELQGSGSTQLFVSKFAP